MTEQGSILTHARAMRRDPTPPERTLWRALRHGAVDGLQFRRQAPIGRYIVDFFCPEARLVVEVDGITHVGERRDAVRDAWLHQCGYKVLRFWNNEVMGNLSGVLEVIRESARGRTPHPGPPPQGGREQKALPSPSPLEGEGRGGGSEPPR